MKQASVILPRGIKTVAATGSSGPSLDMLRIPESLQSKAPNELYYPKGFAPLARPHWVALFSDSQFQNGLQSKVDPESAWSHAVQEFTRACKLAGIEALRDKKDPTVNNGVRATLAKRRQTLKRYLDTSELFRVVKVLSQTAKHKYEVLYTGGLKITASVEFEMGDKDALVQYLCKGMGMHHTGPGYSRNLLKNLRVSVIQIRNKKAVLQYEMEVRPPFYVPPTKRTKQDRHQWFDLEFFLPTVNGQRLDNAINRLKF